MTLFDQRMRINDIRGVFGLLKGINSGAINWNRGIKRNKVRWQYFFGIWYIKMFIRQANGRTCQISKVLGLGPSGTGRWRCNCWWRWTEGEKVHDWQANMQALHCNYFRLHFRVAILAVHFFPPSTSDFPAFVLITW